MVPEFRTKVEYVDVKRKVPVFETKTVVEMVPQIKTRTINRTETRTVTDIRVETYMTMVPETKTRTVFKTKYRDVPVTRTETYWENVPQTRYRTFLVKVPRQVQREHVRAYTVKIPYQVQRCVPQHFCRMVPRTITIPIEPCCETCAPAFEELHEVSGAYLNYGMRRLGGFWRRLCDLSLIHI